MNHLKATGKAIPKTGAILLLLAFGLLLSMLQPQAACAQSKPSDAYKQFLHRIYYARDITDFASLLEEGQGKHALSLKGQERRSCLLKYKRSYVAKFRVIKEDVVDTDRAFIIGEGYAKANGQITRVDVRVQMIRQYGHWRVKKTLWTGSVSQDRQGRPARSR